MIEKAVILAFIIFSISGNVLAWDWKDAMDQAIRRNPDLRVKQSLAEAQDLRYENAISLHYPRILLNGEFEEFLDSSKRIRRVAYFGPVFQIPLFSGGKINAGVDVAEGYKRVAEYQTRIESVTQNSKLRQAFASAVYAKNYLDLSHRIENQRKENLKFTKVRYESGLEYKWVYLSSDAKWKQAVLDIKKADLNNMSAISDLEDIIGPIAIKSVEEIDSSDFYPTQKEYNLTQATSDLDQHPRYLAQQSQVDAAIASVDYSRADSYPRVGASANTWIGDVKGVGIFPYITGIVGFSMPLFQDGYVRRNVSIAKSMVEQEKFTLVRVQLDLRTQLEKNYRTYLTSIEQVSVSRLNDEASEDRSKVVSNQYRSGLTTFLDWEDSQDGWVDAESQLLDNIRNYQVARAKLEESMGVELGNL